VQFLEPPSTDGPPRTDDLREEYGPVTVPPDQYFMMGDNRDNSEDSRYWGFMPRSYVKGQALFIYYSFDDNGSMTSAVTATRWDRLFKRVR
jgi:signal peptidase I